MFHHRAMFDDVWCQRYPVWPGLYRSCANNLRIRCVIIPVVRFFFPINFSLEAKMYLRGNLRAKRS